MASAAAAGPGPDEYKFPEGACSSDLRPEEFCRESAQFPSGILRANISNGGSGESSPLLRVFLESFRVFFSERGYKYSDSLPLRVNDPTLLLMNSTVAVFKDEMRLDESIGKRAMTQLCFRSKQKTVDYLYSFNMAGVSADISHLDGAYEAILNYLEHCQIPREAIHVVLHPDDRTLVEASRKLFDPGHIHEATENGKYHVRWKFGYSELSGRGLTLAAKMEGGASSDPFSPCFVPLGNVILVDNGSGERYVDVGFGVECILSYFYNGIIFDIPFFASQLEALREIDWLDGKEKFLLKALLGFITLYSEGIFPGSKKENYVAAKVQNDLFTFLHEKKKDPLVIDLLFSKLEKSYSREEIGVLRECAEFLKRNYAEYIRTIDGKIKSSLRLAKKLVKKGHSEESINSQIKGTFGLPEDTIRTVFMAAAASVRGARQVIKLAREVATKWVRVDPRGDYPAKFKQGVVKADTIAKAFLAYFLRQPAPMDHRLIRGASVLPDNDPTLLYINSGMAAIKPFFTREKVPPHPRLCNVQPCIRTGDIDDIGDMHHLSFFHMLGSWSIGDYYKQGAIELAYDLLVNVLGFPKEKLYATVFAGDEKLGIGCDNESIAHWKTVGFAEDHIVPLPAEDNFWGPAGDTGPCGPCTEIFYDMGDDFAPAYEPGKGETFDTQKRYVEIWNGGVFMQMFKNNDGTFRELAMKSVDTGSGLERMTMTMNGHNSVYETDLIKPIYDLVEKALPDLDVKTKRVLTDHFRTAVYLISEGVHPGNNGREYIVKKLIRKCVTAITLAGKDVSVVRDIVPATIRFLGESYPHFEGNERAIEEVIITEVRDFEDVLSKGIALIERYLPEDGPIFSGKHAHFLVTSMGLPIEVLQKCLAAKGLALDLGEYRQLAEAHKAVSKQAKGASAVMEVSEEMTEILTKIADTRFVGYDQDTATEKVLVLFQNGKNVGQISNQELFQFAIESTPFYAEGGGQCGDIGLARKTAGGDHEVVIVDTKKVDGVYLHTARLSGGTLAAQEELNLKVDAEHRAGVRRNHSATHLVHHALCQVVGERAIQQGSLVQPGRLRFDFKLGRPLSMDDRGRVELIVNRLIRENHEVVTREMALRDAQASGAIGMFGEKYAGVVRVIKMGPSVELCGGTHAMRTGDLGLFLLQSERSIARGIRRIEAITGGEALVTVQARTQLIAGITAQLRCQEGDIAVRLAAMDHSRRKKFRDVEAKEPEAPILLKEVTFSGDQKFHVLKTDLSSRAGLQEQSKLAFSADEKCVGVLFECSGRKGTTLVAIARSDAPNKLDASKLIAHLKVALGGRGGGNSDYAQCNIAAGKAYAELIDVASIEAAV